MPAAAGRVGVLADGADPEAERRAVEDPPDDGDGDQGEQEAEVQVVAVAEELRHRRRLLHRQRLGVGRAGRLQQALLGQHVEHQVEADVVEHDRDDHLVRAGAGLEEAGEARPRARRRPCRPGSPAIRWSGHGSSNVDSRPSRRPRRPSSIWPRPPMLNSAGAERQPDTEAGRDQRRGELAGLGERPDRGREVLGPGVVDRAAEQRGVGAPDRVPRRRRRSRRAAAKK